MLFESESDSSSPESVRKNSNIMEIMEFKISKEEKRKSRGQGKRMASIHFATLSIRIRHPEISTTHWNNYRKPISCSSSSSFDVLKSKKKSITISHAVNPTESSSSSLSSSSSPSENPEIELEFIGPKAGDAVEKASAISGEKLLRTIMEDNKIELYATYGKLMNCGGGGSCGTCIVEIIDGSELLNERTNTELKYLKKKPESWRLACQTIVGNKENSGKVVVQRLPQWKK